MARKKIIAILIGSILLASGLIAGGMYVGYKVVAQRLHPELAEEAQNSTREFRSGRTKVRHSMTIPDVSDTGGVKVIPRNEGSEEGGAVEEDGRRDYVPVSPQDVLTEVEELIRKGQVESVKKYFTQESFGRWSDWGGATGIDKCLGPFIEMGNSTIKYEMAQVYGEKAVIPLWHKYYETGIGERKCIIDKLDVVLVRQDGHWRVDDLITSSRQ